MTLHSITLQVTTILIAWEDSKEIKGGEQMTNGNTKDEMKGGDTNTKHSTEKTRHV